jgi:ATP-binding cassette subfamily B (MDR/TAP) protein 1
LHIKNGLGFGFLWLIIYAGYSYSLYVGSWFIEEGVKNPTSDEPYNAGDILTCFFGTLFGMFNLGMLEPAMKAIANGKAAAKIAFDIIDRKPLIDIHAGGKKDVPLQGEIELKDIQFYYPTRVDNTVLDNFNCKFEVGKTTALVGPSGSGKSTIVQMIERFYDPVKGQVLVDG